MNEAKDLDALLTHDPIDQPVRVDDSFAVPAIVPLRHLTTHQRKIREVHYCVVEFRCDDCCVGEGVARNVLGDPFKIGNRPSEPGYFASHFERRCSTSDWGAKSPRSAISARFRMVSMTYSR